MIRFGFALLLILPIGQGIAQCVISQDPQGRVITTCQSYQQTLSNQLEHQGAVTHNEVKYLGSEYFTYPSWQNARVQLGEQEITCRLAYNLATQEVDYQLNHAATPERIRPDAFTIRGYRFIRMAVSGTGKNGLYLMVVQEGNTRVLKHVKSQLKLGGSTSGYIKPDEFKGAYEVKETYFIQKGSATPEAINLTGKSVMAVLGDQAETLPSLVASGKLPLEAVLEAVKAYDAQVAKMPSPSAAVASGPPINRDPVFSQVLRDQIKYPSMAVSERIYSRVYAGFDIDETGQIRNIVILSPDNAGYAFDYQVKQALKKLPLLKPDYQGRYVLPVAFTYLNTRNESTAHVPVNKLPLERMGNRTELNELTVPIVVAKSGSTGLESREVWGYFK